MYSGCTCLCACAFAPCSCSVHNSIRMLLCHKIHAAPKPKHAVTIPSQYRLCIEHFFARSWYRVGFSSPVPVLRLLWSRSKSWPKSKPYKNTKTFVTTFRTELYIQHITVNNPENVSSVSLVWMIISPSYFPTQYLWSI